uniref:Ribosome-inactivating protein SNAI' n=1 Tax=Sambucus nigra TaxID=4202 RepID=RIP1_SAMNI|nr:RecName: Full=Ribosome-inactivating protein SNAI'; Contains: RecName: Full=SNAI' A chain; AltName: Full=rRNA N-glycosidase; Contains: RecName: Full=Linker peptide; Contains: RecName: Full=SNAI' B chain; Flags: Precursor [Sambucus nigra]AAC49754.1 Neu5Ac alpha-2,6-gal/galNAc-binding type 2 ribosome-inactivating protein precusor [Sambucus nigra]
MKVVATILYLVVLAICGLGIHGAHPTHSAPPTVYPSVSFNLTEANSNEYRHFLQELRGKVILGSHRAFDLPVLNPESKVSDSDRFVLVRLTNPSRKKVTLAIDVVTFYVVAFAQNDRSYFFSGSSEVQRENLFVDTTQEDLNFKGDYTSLEHQVGFGRVYIPLGPKSLAQSISSLSTYKSSAGDNKRLARSLLVVIQMVSEAARFRYIQLRIQASITDAKEFTPDLLMLSMENKWSSMSSEIQQAQPGGAFAQVVKLLDQRNHPIDVTNFRRLFQLTSVAVLLHGCPTVTKMPAYIIKMPVFNGGEDEERCSVVEEVTRRIGGRDGFCAEVKNGDEKDGTPVQLSSCGEQSNQQWTFSTDGTIQSLGKCLTTSSSVMIYNCKVVPPESTKWVVSIDGTITNPRSGLVLTAPKAAEGTLVSLEKNVHAARQGWIVGNVEPLVTFIVGYEQMCLETNPGNNDVSLGDCSVKSASKVDQKWALYGDGTIRVNNDRSLCVTSEGKSSNEPIIILKCLGWANQRWVFNTDGTISNPDSKLVMHVDQNDVPLRKIILSHPSGTSNQQWIASTHPA